MALVWLLVLAIFGASNGFSTIPALAWLLLIPFVLQDFYDIRRR